MPFTPFHAGIAMAIKPFAPRHFSLTAFCVAQIAMDLEPLLGMVTGRDILHGITHTFVAAPIIALPCAALTPLIRTPLIRRFNHEVTFLKMPWLREPLTTSRAAVLTGALSGTISHVVLDSLMHLDIRPFAPFSAANPLMGLIPHAGVYWLCTLAGIAGLAGWMLRKRLEWQRSKPASPEHKTGA